MIEIAVVSEEQTKSSVAHGLRARMRDDEPNLGFDLLLWIEPGLIPVTTDWLDRT